MIDIRLSEIINNISGIIYNSDLPIFDSALKGIFKGLTNTDRQIAPDRLTDRRFLSSFLSRRLFPWFALLGSYGLILGILFGFH